ncbi:MAG TPA: flagellar motor protein MotB [Dissulfurispiraceae bacterium]|nr:flagellar motor protein MotB [Dissulfurispiraceae bacterium]
MADKSKTIIIRKVKKSHGGHHGGSWKVAYADFVTAMMAFFLLLWLISMVTPEKRAVLADYFRNFNVFQQGGRSFMEQSSSIKSEVKTSTAEVVTGEMSVEDVKDKLKAAIEEQLKSLKDQVILDIVDGGVRIQLVDLEGRPMFPSGSAEPNEKCRQIIKVVSENIKDYQGRIAVEGHTDASPFKKSGETNWELSTARASSARKELERDGIDPNRVARVVGYADTEPLIKEDPSDLRNRRISIILLSARPKPAAQTANSQSAAGPSEKADIPQPTIVPPAAEPKPQQPAVVEPSVAKTNQQQDAHTSMTDKDRKKIIDTGIKPDKPIDVRPSIFPGLDR